MPLLTVPLGTPHNCILYWLSGFTSYPKHWRSLKSNSDEWVGETVEEHEPALAWEDSEAYKEGLPYILNPTVSLNNSMTSPQLVSQRVHRQGTWNLDRTLATLDSEDLHDGGGCMDQMAFTRTGRWPSRDIWTVAQCCVCLLKLEQRTLNQLSTYFIVTLDMCNLLNLINIGCTYCAHKLRSFPERAHLIGSCKHIILNML
jgi:hypothetical protein